ncbi:MULTISPECIES: DNA recombination protein RmuC [unclassified Sphingopyxis]|uniref:DNA recombination protein RmuC n=1 Tax=unclassified Sphingopyxis TaxID=2614943 RepID=UPI0007300AB2|nr:MULTISPECIES: DNA recombination protein RmuC [unclassified Sphingopyxis]KTE25934.1 recombinase RmuC [Sphingopyxis sp. H057]KTE51614.1 recombinase RmuC [Sphingopyxis sp. H073]KTE53882.1 recombinase RmuC [Sphingopyxis sp. H071]KTE58886.1 recombinase RmuC [Sphingopyxis sp. H107]KTE65507.1 recombinase RmuC [Sphingopyxis sp. H100]
MDITALVIALAALCLGGLIGWLLAGRQAGALKAERDGLSERFKAAVADLAAEAEARKAADLKLASLLAEQRAREEAHEAQIAQLRDAQTALTAQFREVGQAMLGEAQKAFLERAEQRFKQSEETAGQNLKALLSPVHERLQKYEEAVGKVEAERRDAFGLLHGQIAAMREGTERVSSEAAKLVNALRNAPKARGRWGEQQLRNVLESCGLSEHADFQTEVSVADGDGGRLRPDVVVKVPGGQSLVIDAKVSLNAYQDAFGAVDESEKAVHLAAHAAAMKAHVNTLGAKSYWNQFDDTPDFVVMFVPGEHFLAAALDQDHELWDYAFERKVLLATPTNLIAIARTVAAVWRQEKLAGQAREIAALGKELYARMSVMGSHIARVGKNLDQATGAYNAFVGSFESQVLTQAKRFEALDVETGDREIAPLPVAEQTARPLAKLASAPAAVNDASQ